MKNRRKKRKKHFRWLVFINSIDMHFGQLKTILKIIILITWVIYLYFKVKYESVTKRSDYRNKNVFT